MKKHLLHLLIVLIVAPVFCGHRAYSQCNSPIPIGVNLISNGDFEQGLTNFSTDYNLHNPGKPHSDPLEYYVGNDAKKFHIDFLPIQDHTSGTGNALFVDGSCNLGPKVWYTTVSIIPNTNYYFSAWITPIYPTTPLASSKTGVLKFTVLVPGNAKADSLGTLVSTVNVGEWVEYTRNWYSGTDSGLVTIAIESTLISDCTNGNDFAIDDITFTAGCAFISNGPKPDLGPDFTLCGKVLPVTLLSGINPPYTNVNFKWSTGETTSSITVSQPGTYSLCVDSAGSCTRQDIITITDDYSVDLGPDINLLCQTDNSVKITTGIADSSLFTSVKWFKDGTEIATASGWSFINVNTTGTYKVVVEGPNNCDATDEVNVTSSYSINLGSDIQLCRPPYTTLKSGIVDSAYFNSIKWFKNGAEIITSSDRTSLRVNTPGTYIIAVEGPGNCDAKDTIQVTSAATTIPVNGTYCVATGSTKATLSVTGPTTIKWFATQTDTNVLATGLSYTTPDLTSPGPVTYWAEDSTTFSGIVGESGTGFSNPGNRGGSSTNGLLKFDALIQFKIDSIRVGYYSFNCTGTRTIVINILDNANQVIGTSTATVPCKGFDPSFYTIPVGITIPAGTGYTINAAGSGADIAWYEAGPANWFKTYAVNGNDVLKITANAFDQFYAQWSSPAYFDWKISVGASCGRIPVYATEECICAPVITKDPDDASTCTGGVSFTVANTGLAPFTYQWQEKTPSGTYQNLSNGGVYAGTDATTLTISSVTGLDQNQYRAIVTGTCPAPGTNDTSKVATLSISGTTTITSPPANANICAINNARFVVKAIGSGLTYQWQEKSPSGSFTDITNAGKYSGATDDSLLLTGMGTSMSGYTYQCIVKSICAGPVTTSLALLTVDSAGSILTQPQNITVCEPDKAPFKITAAGTNLNYQWQEKTPSGTFTNLVNGVNYSGAKTDSLTIVTPTANMSGNTYFCVITDNCSNTINSSVATLTVKAGASITTQPKDATVCPGDSAKFNVVASGTGLSYQWKIQTTPGTFVNIPGAMSSNLSIPNVTAAVNNTVYQCEITNDCPVSNTKTTTQNVTLKVDSGLVFTDQPKSITNCPYGNVQFIVKANGSNLTYQWKEKIPGGTFVNVPAVGKYSGTNNDTLSISGVSANMSGNEYQCVVTSPCAGSVASSNAILTIHTLSPLNLGNDTTFCFGVGNIYTIKPASGYASYSWQNGSKTQNHMVLKPGKYVLLAQHTNGCFIKDSVSIKGCDEFEIYNVITPRNKDGVNDEFVILGNVPNSRLEIYSRWGTLIYETKNYENNWTGEDQSEGIYYYIYTKNTKKPITGWVEIIK